MWFSKCGWGHLGLEISPVSCYQTQTYKIVWKRLIWVLSPFQWRWSNIQKSHMVRFMKQDFSEGRQMMSEKEKTAIQDTEVSGCAHESLASASGWIKKGIAPEEDAWDRDFRNSDLRARALSHIVRVDSLRTRGPDSPARLIWTEEAIGPVSSSFNVLWGYMLVSRSAEAPQLEGHCCSSTLKSFLQSTLPLNNVSIYYGMGEMRLSGIGCGGLSGSWSTSSRDQGGWVWVIACQVKHYMCLGGGMGIIEGQVFYPLMIHERKVILLKHGQ